MAILQGFIKTIKRRLTVEGYKWQSEKTSSQTVVMGDGTDNTDTAEKRFGAIKGLTSSTSVTDTGYALDATIGKKHEDSIATLNQSLSACTKTKSDGTRFLMTDNQVYVTDPTNKAWKPVRALNFTTDKGDLNYLIETSYCSLKSLTGLTTLNYGKNCNRGVIICNNILTNKIMANKWTTIVTLPSGYRPCINTPFQCHYGTILVIGQILTNGIIQVYSTFELATNSQALSINTQYII